MAMSEVVASASRTATGNSGAIAHIGDDNVIALLVDVTAVTGTSPTMDLSIEWGDGTTWHPADTAQTFTQITATTTVAKEFAVLGDQYRIVWTLGGTSPDFTFSIQERVRKTVGTRA